MSTDVKTGGPGDFVGVKVSGLSDLSKDLKRADKELVVALKKETKAALEKEVKPTAEKLAPKKSGGLANTIRVMSVTNRASLAVGSKAKPYGPPIHWGWPSRGIAAQPFLTDAIYKEQDDIERAFFKVVDTLRNRVLDGSDPTR